MMNHPRGGLTAPIARKRKERDGLFIHPINGSGKPRVTKTPSPLPSPLPSHPKTTSLKQKPSEPAWSNRLVAGYLAHEFLTQGSLLGQKFDPAGAEAKPAGSSAVGGSEPEPEPEKGYAEVARILKTDGAHIPGIVNPTQLARWIQM